MVSAFSQNENCRCPDREVASSIARQSDVLIPNLLS